MAPSSRHHSSKSSSEDESLRSESEKSRSLPDESSESDSDQGSRDEKHPNSWSSKANAVRARRRRARGSRVSSRAEKRNQYDSDRKNIEKNRGEEFDKDEEELRREGARRNADEEMEEMKSRPFVVEDPFVQQLVAAFYQCLKSCVGLVLEGNPISPFSLEQLLQNSIRNVEIGGGSAVVPALQCVVDGFRGAVEEWRSLRAACSAPLAEEAGAQREAARKALEALSEEVAQLQARANQLSTACEAKSLTKESEEIDILNAQAALVRAQRIIAERWRNLNLLEEEVGKLFQEQNQVELAIAEKKKAMAAAQARLAKSAGLAEAESRQAREALQEQLAAREAAMKALVRQ